MPQSSAQFDASGPPLRLYTGGDDSLQPAPPEEALGLQPFDILACYGADHLSRIVTFGTFSPFGDRRLRRPPSHVAIISPTVPKTRRLLAVESTTLCPHPCLYRGLHVAGAQAHWPHQRIEDYAAAGGRVDVYRINRLIRLGLDADRLAQLLIEGFVRRSLAYDMRGAILSGTWYRYFRHLAARFSQADLETLFCSEMVAFALMACGAMNWDNPAKYTPGRLLRYLRRCGIYTFHTSFEAES